MCNLGKYTAADYRYAALKAASRGHTDILMRKTNSKEVRQFAGRVVTLPEPKVVTREGRKDPVCYSKKPVVTSVKKFAYEVPKALAADEANDAVDPDPVTPPAPAPAPAPSADDPPPAPKAARTTRRRIMT
jgi:hypothetical protein